MNVLLISGSPSPSSRSRGLLEALAPTLERLGVRLSRLAVQDIPAQALLQGDMDHPAVQAWQRQVREADGLVIATPVYKASFAGALKVLLDLLPERALEDKVVLTLVTGGTAAHMLAVDYALKPVLAALRAEEILAGVFAVTQQVHVFAEAGTVELDPILAQRLERAGRALLQALRRRPRTLDPRQLASRLVQGRWSI